MKAVVFLLIILSSLICEAKLIPLVMGRPYRAKRIQSIQEYQSFLNAALKDAGFEVIVKEFPGQIPYDMLVKGEIDGLSYDDLSLKHDRDQTVSVSFPIIKTNARYFYLKNNHDINLDTLKKFRGCLSLNNSILQEEAKRRKLNVFSTANPLQSVQMLLEGKADYFLAVEEVGKSAINATPDSRKRIAMSDDIFIDVPLYLTLKKSYKKDLPKIEEAFRKRLTGDLKDFPMISANLNKNP